MLQRNIKLLPSFYTKGIVILLFVLWSSSTVISQKTITLDSLCSLYVEDSLFTNFCHFFKAGGQGPRRPNVEAIAHQADSLGLIYLNNAKYIRAGHLFVLASNFWRDLEQDKELSNSLIRLGRTQYRQGNIFDSFKNTMKG